MTHPAALVFASMLAMSMLAAPAHAQDTVREAARTLFGGTITSNDIDAVATVLALQTAVFPVGTSSGGFTYRIDPKTASPELNTQGFGPLFAERALTLGSQGSIALGISAQATRFESFEGRRLRNGDLRSRIAAGSEILDFHRFTFNLSTQTTTLSAYFAADDDLDIGVIVPIVRTSLTGTVSTISPLAPPLRTEQIEDASATSVGDVVVRGKWNFLRRNRNGLAALLEVFVPTGSEEQLAGTGHWRFRPTLVASAEAGAFSPHGNIGFTFGGSGVRITDNAPFFPVIEQAEPGTEINYALGADVSPYGPLTLFADLIGRSMRSVARFESGRRILPVPGFGAIPIEGFVAREGTLDIRLGAVGARTIVMGSGLISAAVLFPLNEGGLRPGLTPVVGFDFTF